MTETLPQPVVAWSRPESEREGTPLLVLFHGYLSHEKDLIGLAPMLPEEFTLASVRAPYAMGPGYTWFPLMEDLDYSLEKVVESVQQVWAWLEEVKEQHASVTLLGFSMGMAVATSVLRHRPEEIDAVVGLSGFAIQAAGHEFFNDQATKAARTPMFWGRGQADPVITEEKIDFTLDWAGEHTDLTKMLYAGMGHSVSEPEMKHVGEFLRHHVLD
ncbi:MAG: alpha/beta hydrolase [Arthrobacter sp.]|uniref:alpha/beta hydrolase n=1 Tax=unclassified Arthrobacter TaxID=235627 RepID=UPI00264A5CE4|nr:phospholipase [Micrococcaceae bacterium]MDN5814108.1 phospholipase [Micrococcaceae bacterium]MDN5824114.1 phospholipase [Micrococcaceae bacterium]MDN5880676.1 phospholipase [Micrococcaceae bacterium]MDN5888044.1 phospholipase [Micrococcaceae bacterium]